MNWCAQVGFSTTVDKCGGWI